MTDSNIDTFVLDQPSQTADAGMHVDGYVQGQLAATSQARFKDSDGPPVLQISVDTNELSHLIWIWHT